VGMVEMGFGLFGGLILIQVRPEKMGAGGHMRQVLLWVGAWVLLVGYCFVYFCYPTVMTADGVLGVGWGVLLCHSDFFILAVVYRLPAGGLLALCRHCFCSPESGNLSAALSG